MLPAAGRIAWDGADIAQDREAHRARLSYLGHQDAVKAGLTALENLHFWASFGGGDARAALATFSLDAVSPTGRRGCCPPDRGGAWRWRAWLCGACALVAAG